MIFSIHGKLGEVTANVRVGSWVVSQGVVRCGFAAVQNALEADFPAIQDRPRISKDGAAVRILKACHR